MKTTPRVLLAILAVTAGAVLGGATPGAAQVSPPPTDSLYVGDAADNSVKRFDVHDDALTRQVTEQFVGTFMHGGLHGARGGSSTPPTLGSPTKRNAFRQAVRPLPSGDR